MTVGPVVDVYMVSKPEIIGKHSNKRKKQQRTENLKNN